MEVWWILGNKDHPRVCGEKRSDNPALASEHGSPPRVRGKETLVKQTTLKVGITPACAGKSFIFQRRMVEFGDHPRVCGEK